MNEVLKEAINRRERMIAQIAIGQKDISAAYDEIKYIRKMEDDFIDAARPETGGKYDEMLKAANKLLLETFDFGRSGCTKIAPRSKFRQHLQCCTSPFLAPYSTLTESLNRQQSQGAQGFPG